MNAAHRVYILAESNISMGMECAEIDQALIASKY